MSLFGYSVFTDLSPAGIAALVAIYFFSFVMKGMFGFGAMAPLVIFGAWVVGPHHAVVLAVVSNIFSQLQFTPEGLRYGNWCLARSLVLAYMLAAMLGVWIFGALESAGLTVVVGVGLVGIIVLESSSLLRRYEKVIRERSALLGPVIAAISGVIGGVVGAGGVILVSTYIKVICKEPRSLRATILLITSFFVGWRALLYAASGFVPLSVLVESVILLPAVFVGGHIGSRLFGSFPKDRYFPALRIFLIVAALNLVIKGVMAILTS